MRWIRGAYVVAAFVACRHDRKPVMPPPDDMVSIPARAYIGTAFTCPTGTNMPRKLSEILHVQLQAPAFQLDRQLVTCEQFERCVSAGACKRDDLLCVDHVVSLHRDTAAAYCQWRNAKLPSWIEWQLAVRGPEGWDYPTGNQKPEPGFEEVGGTRTTSSLGIEYRFNAEVPLNQELTRDDDCIADAPDAPGRIGSVTGTTAIRLGEGIDTPGNERGSFRCVRD